MGLVEDLGRHRIDDLLPFPVVVVMVNLGEHLLPGFDQLSRWVVVEEAPHNEANSHVMDDWASPEQRRTLHRDTNAPRLGVGPVDTAEMQLADRIDELERKALVRTLGAQAKTGRLSARKVTSPVSYPTVGPAGRRRVAADGLRRVPWDEARSAHGPKDRGNTFSCRRWSGAQTVGSQTKPAMTLR